MVGRRSPGDGTVNAERKEVLEQADVVLYDKLVEQAFKYDSDSAQKLM
ncbi:MAG: hypothetical protein ACLR13_06840 [Acutalibacteraceae bacterium]